VSGGSVFLNLLGAAEGALIRAAASTQRLCGVKRMMEFAERQLREYHRLGKSVAQI